MMTGQAKTDYQREYMRKRRSNKIHLCPAVRPGLLDPKRKEVLDLEPVAVLDPVDDDLCDGYNEWQRGNEEAAQEESIHDQLANTPLEILEAGGAWIPNWRRAQG